MRNILNVICAIALCCSVQAREYHVSLRGSDSNEGTIEKPFKTINWAAQKALPGDTITVHAGTYREWINPLNGGESDQKRIVYQAADGENVEIKGSELIKGWTKEKGGNGVWKVTLSNDFFGSYNPYNDKLFGDWLLPGDRVHHTGDVYLNDVSLYEVTSKEKVLNPDTIYSVRDPKGSLRVWFACVDSINTTIYANFGPINPNEETVEISVRPTCFYPTRQGLNYITIKGFRVSQAATQWAAPTAEQIGMIATHWCKGWIIENNIIKNSRCNGISLGKERSTGHNLEETDKRLDGTQHYIEVIFNTIRKGWNKDNVGSHIVRNNVISDCEQTGICGSMGGAFSEIYGNHIYNIHVKRQFGGYEMAGIKLHGAIDTYLHHNRVHDCIRGFWLDWMTQGTRISSNLFYRNATEDLFVEVSHGPYIVDNNLFLSQQSLFQLTDGGAYLNNLFAGRVVNQADNGRYTPYHLNHSTEIKGIITMKNGDHRFYNNIFIGQPQKDTYGLRPLDEAVWPIYAEDNIFCHGALPMKDKRQGVVKENLDPKIQIEETRDSVYMVFDNSTMDLFSVKAKPISSERLGITKLSGYPYENADGTPFSLIKDYFGNHRSESTPIIGPFEEVNNNRIKLW